MYSLLIIISGYLVTHYIEYI